MKKKCYNCGGKTPMYDWGGFSSLKENPYAQIPGSNPNTTSALQSINGPSINNIGRSIPEQQGTWKMQPTFDINYNHIAASNVLKAGVGFLSQRKKRADFESYNRLQSNPLLQLPFTPNTSEQSRYGMEYSRKGGPTFDDRFKKGYGWDYYEEGGPKQGDPKSNKPTTTDSLALYNNSIQLQNYYNSKNYTNKEVLGSFSKEAFDSRQEVSLNDMKRRISRGLYPITNRGSGNDTNMKLEDYYRKLDDNRYFQREQANSILDLRSPWALYDKRINPQSVSTYRNINMGDKLNGDIVQIGMYDPIAVKPWNMLTDSERKVRIQKYGYPEGYQQPKQPKQTQEVDSSNYLKPITTNNSNDPRLKRYQDSLAAYKYSRDLENKIINTNQPSTVEELENFKKSLNPQYQIGNIKATGKGFFPMKNSNPLKDKNIMIPEFMEPRQPVIYNPKDNKKANIPPPPPRPYGVAQVQGIQGQQPSINVQPNPFRGVPINQKNFTYNDISAGPYDNQKGQVVYDGNKLVGYLDANGNQVDASHFGIIDPNKKKFGGLMFRDSKFTVGYGKDYYDDGGYVDFDQEFEDDLTKAPIEQLVEQTPDNTVEDITPEEESRLSQGFYEQEDTLQYKSSAERLNFLMDKDEDNVETNPYSLGASIGKIESNNNYSAFNPKGGGAGAVGKYQFRWNQHKNGIASITGVTDKNEFLNNPYAQEKYFKSWDKTVLTPTANDLLPYAQLKNPNATIDDVKKQIHFAGPAGAAKFYKEGVVTKDAMGTSNYTYDKFKEGGEYEIDEDQLQDLIAQGFKFNIL